MANQFSPWTLDELKELREIWPSKAKEDVLAALPNRSFKAITTKAGRIRVPRGNLRQPRLYLEGSDVPYFAGILDGEGSIVVGRKKYFCPVIIQVGNTNFELIYWINERIPAYVTYYMQPSGNRKPQAKWVLHEMATAQALLRLLLPYLIVKRKIAQLTLDFLDSRIQHPRRRYNGFELRLVAEIQPLNRRGRISESANGETECR